MLFDSGEHHAKYHLFGDLLDFSYCLLLQDTLVLLLVDFHELQFNLRPAYFSQARRSRLQMHELGRRTQKRHSDINFARFT